MSGSPPEFSHFAAKPDTKIKTDMANDARAYLRIVLSLWAALCAIAFYYFARQGVPRFIVLAFLGAALVETALYVGTGFRSAREIFESVQPPALRALALTVSAVLPYLIYSSFTGTFHLRWAGLLALLATIASSWFIVQTRRSPLIDMLFLAVMAAVFLTRVFPRIYIELHPRIPAAILGQLMWIRIGIMSVLSFRKLGGIGFGFLPSLKEWNIGMQQFVAFVPAAVLLDIWLRFANPAAPEGPWWRTVAVMAGTFCGILWVVALSEEFFFRGVLQQALSRLTNSNLAGLALASIAFGLVHLPFRHFPNWRFSVLAGVAGLFYGIGYMRAGSIRAAMVTHALVVTAWRVFFR
jgi:membrane protease YdiL (CAAX protease family)